MLFCPELIGFCFVFHKRLKTYISPEGGDLEWIRPLISCCLNLLGIVHVSSWSIVKNSLETYINERALAKQIFHFYCMYYNLDQVLEFTNYGLLYRLTNFRCFFFFIYFSIVFNPIFAGRGEL